MAEKMQRGTGDDGDRQTGGGGSHRGRKGFHVSTASPEGGREKDRKREAARKTDRQRRRVEAAKPRTEFKDCTAKAFFKVENLIRLFERPREAFQNIST